MSEQNNEIEKLLKNIQEGLKRYSVKELNQAIISFLNKKEDKLDEIEFILRIVSSEYNISIHTLKKENARGLIQEAKQIAYCLLHFNLGLSTRYIAKRVFFNWHTSVYSGIKRFKEIDINLKQDREFMEKYQLLNQKMIEHFTQKKLEYEH